MPKNTYCDFFKNKLIVITGGGSGLGLQMASKITSYGGKVIIIDRALDKLVSAKNDIMTANPAAFLEYFQTDVSNHNQVERTFHNIYETYGSIDGVIANAGQVYIKDFRLIPIEKIENRPKAPPENMSKNPKRVFRCDSNSTRIASVLIPGRGITAPNR